MNPALITGLPGGFEILIILFVILLLFGGKKLPELARSLGRSLGEFRKGRADSAAEKIPSHEDGTEGADSGAGAEEDKQKAP